MRTAYLVKSTGGYDLSRKFHIINIGNRILAALPYSRLRPDYGQITARLRPDYSRLRLYGSTAHSPTPPE